MCCSSLVEARPSVKKVSPFLLEVGLQGLQCKHMIMQYELYLVSRQASCCNVLGQLINVRFSALKHIELHNPYSH